jgi:hypothetical protein
MDSNDSVEEVVTEVEPATGEYEEESRKARFPCPSCGEVHDMDIRDVFEFILDVDYDLSRDEFEKMVEEYQE